MKYVYLLDDLSVQQIFVNEADATKAARMHCVPVPDNTFVYTGMKYIPELNVFYDQDKNETYTFITFPAWKQAEIAISLNRACSWLVEDSCGLHTKLTDTGIIIDPMQPGIYVVRLRLLSKKHDISANMILYARN